MRSKTVSRWISFVMAATVAFSGIPATNLSAEETNTDLLLNLDFNTEAVDGVFSGGKGKAIATGGYSLEEKVGTDKALRLDGSNGFLNVVATDDSALLAGLEEITISYDVKAEKGSKSWPFFAAENANKQSYPNEHYLGILQTSGGITVERYDNNGVRPGNNLSATTDNKWMHVDVVVTEDHTQLYVNGVMTDESDSDYKLSEILTETGGVLQIGKANWDNGEYFGGLLDNFRIYNKPLAAEAITAQYEEFKTSLEEIAAGEKVKDFLAEVESLTISSDVRSDIGLVKTLKSGATVEWTSSNPEVITDSDANADSIWDGGIVTRPAAGKSAVDVKLTAKITSADGTMTETKSFDVTVAPMPADLDTDYSAGYFWPHFDASGGYEKIFFGYSEDGLTWNKLNKVGGVAQPVLVNDAKNSDLGVRDPHLIRSADGDKYWLIGTDLHAEGGGAGGSGWNQLSASQNIVVWESNDLVNWSEPYIVYSGFDNAGCVWAPEAYYDEVNGDYVVYWSIRDKSLAGTNDNALRVYVCRTRDFHSFTESKVWLSEDPATSSEINIIDSTIVEDNGKFYRFSTSDWNTIVDVSDTLDTEDVLDVRVSEEASTPNGSWTRLVTRAGTGAAGFTRAEGFTVFKLPDGKWCAMGDDSGYKAFTTDDLASGKFTSASVSFPDGRFRHGSVMQLSETEEAALLAAYGTVEEEKPAPNPTPGEKTEPVLTYDFEADVTDKTVVDTGKGDTVADNATLFGNASVVYDDDLGSKVLKLDGSSGSYAAFPQGFFDGRNTMTISMDVKSNMDSGNFFTFTFGKDSTYYNFMRVRGTAVRNAITTTSWENEAEVVGTGAATGEWQRIVIVFDGTTMKLYIDGALAATNSGMGMNVSSLGTDLLGYLGKSFYSGDVYFKGSFDNVEIYDRALTGEEILNDVINKMDLVRGAVIGTVPMDPANTMGTDDHTAITSNFDKETKTITSWVRKGTNRSAIPVELKLLTDDVEVTLDGKPFVNGSIVDLTYSVELVAKLGDRTETYTLKRPSIAGNPVLPGQYADPDIDFFNGKYWIYPTTDGVSGWGGTVFHAWSSKDLVNWEDEGIILDVKDKNPGLNDKGNQIAVSPWSQGNAWAPTIEEVNGKYYFAYCGQVNSEYNAACVSGAGIGDKAIGIAVADKPEGPFVAQDMPLLYPTLVKNSGCGYGGQIIDPGFFTDDNGDVYLLFGNGNAGICQLDFSGDEVKVMDGTIRKFNGMHDHRESPNVIKRDGIYHFTWSCDDTGSPNYHVNYGVIEGYATLADALAMETNTLTVTYKDTLLEKDEAGDMLGTAHQSVYYNEATDECYIAYHRFYTPLGIYTSGLGYHRETCIDKITFDEKTGYMKKVKPTMEGFYVDTPEGEKPVVKPEESVKPAEIKVTGITVSNNIGVNKLQIAKGKKVTLSAVVAPENATLKDVTWESSKTSVATVDASGVVKAKKPGTAIITATAKDGSGVKATVSVKVVKGAVKKIKIKGNKTVKAGRTVKLKAVVTASKGANKKVVWTSKNPELATVSASGKVKVVKGVKKGKKIKIEARATDGSGKKATFTIKVK